MAFKGFEPGLQEKFNGWRVPISIRDGFKDGLRVLEQLSPRFLPCDEDGLFFVIDVDDQIVPTAGYTFTLRLRRNDTDFWVADINYFEVNGAGDLIASSDPMP